MRNWTECSRVRSLALAIVATLAAGGIDARLATAAADPVHSVPREAVAERLAQAFPLSAPAGSGGTVIMGDPGDITTLNPMLSTDDLTDSITGLVFQTLVDLSPVDGSIVPQLADSYEIAADGVTYTFDLNRRAAWHDGVDLTADDVVFSYDMILDPAMNSPFQSQIDDIVDSYRAVDADTFELRSAGPLATVLYDAVEVVPIVPKHIWDGVPPAAWPTDPGSTGEDPARVVGTGPFRFVARELAAGTTTFARNETYWDTLLSRVPVIDRFIFRVLPDEAAAVQALIAGDVDIYEALPGPLVAEVEASPDRAVAIYPTLDFNYYTLNLDPAKTTLFQQREVRQALLLALDREAIVDGIYGGFGEVPVGTQPKLSPAYAPERIRTRYPYDPDRARALLAEAGWTDADGDGTVEREGRELSFEMIFPADQAGEQLAAYFQQAWGEVGVEMTPELMPFEAMIAEDGPLATHDFEGVQIGLSWTADGGQGLLFTCDAYEAGFNVAKYCNLTFDRLEEQQLRELDPAARRDILIEQTNIVNDDLPIAVFRFAEGRTGYSERLHNFYPNDYNLLWSLPFVWVDGP